MAIVLVQKRAGLGAEKLRFPTSFHGVVKNAKGEVLADSFSGKDPIELGSGTITLDTDTEEGKRWVEIYEILAGKKDANGKLKGSPTWDALVDGGGNQTHRIFSPLMESEQALEDDIRINEYLDRVYKLSEGQVDRLGVIFQLSGLNSIKKRALAKMLEDKATSENLIKFLDMEADRFDIFVTIQSALKLGDSRKRIGVYEDNGMIFFNNTPMASTVEQCVNWLSKNEDNIKILQGIKILIGESVNDSTESKPTPKKAK